MRALCYRHVKSGQLLLSNLMLVLGAAHTCGEVRLACVLAKKYSTFDTYPMAQVLDLHGAGLVLLFGSLMSAVVGQLF